MTKPKPVVVDTRSKVAIQIAEVLMTILGVEAGEIKPESSIRDDLGADSLDIVEIVMGLEEEFGLVIDDSDADKFKTVGDVVAFFEKLVK